jgi:hypothetical protein
MDKEQQRIDVELPTSDEDVYVWFSWNTEPCFTVAVITEEDKTLFRCSTLPLNGTPSTTATLVIMD